MSRAVLRVLIMLNLLLGAGVMALMAGSILFEDLFLRALAGRAAAAADIAGLIGAMRMIMIVGIAALPLTHIVLRRLLAIVETVRLGDPFTARNAARLQTIAWALLALQLLHFAVGGIVARASQWVTGLDIDGRISVTGWLAVLLLFVLARVFRHGTRMREELEATV